MKKALNKDFWMEIRKNKARFISIFCIVTLGVAFFSGIQATSPDMRSSGDAYFDSTHLMDIKVMGTMGMTETDVAALKAIDGVEDAEGAFSTDVLCGDEGAQTVIHIESINEAVNQLTISEGRLPEKSGECFLDEAYAKSEGFQIGDTLTFRQAEDSELLLKEKFTVTGFGNAPLYISTTRGNTTLGSGQLSGFAYVLPEDFDQEVFTQVYLRVHGAEGITSYTDAYDNLIDKIEERVDGISAQQCQLRYEEVVSEAQTELDEAKEELEDARKEAEEELADAAEELADGEEKLEDGKKEYEDGVQELKDAKAEIEDGKKELADAKAELEDGKSQLADARAEVADGWAQLNAGKAELASGWSQYYAGKEELDASGAELSAASEQITAGKKELADGKAALEAKQTELDNNKAQLADGIKQVDASITELTATINQLKQGIAGAKAAEEALPALQGAVDAAAAQQSAKQTALNEAQVIKDQKQAAAVAAQSAYDAAKAEADAGNLSAEELAGYENAKNEAINALQGAEQAYNTAVGELTAAQAAYDAVNGELAETQSAYDTASSALTAAQSAYQTASAELAQYQQLAAQKSTLESSLQQAESGVAQAEQKKAELQNLQSQIPAGQAQIDAAWKTIAEKEALLKANETKVSAGLKEWQEGKNQLAASYQQLASGQAELDANEQQLASAQAQIDSSAAELASGEAEIAENEQKLTDAETELADGEKELEDAKKELEDAEKELEDGKKEYEDGKKEAEEEITDAEKEIEDAQKEIDDLEVPEWIVSDRGDLPEYADYGDNADRIKSLGKVFPVIFFLVAALISLTTMTRMVEEQRTQIGTLKALGYGKYDIASKYLNYAFLATVSGSILGFLIGEKLIPYIIINAYGTVYKSMAAILKINYQFKYALIAAGASVLCTVGATLFSCYKVLAETPASLMRPPAPKEGKRVLIERITFLWKHLSFSWKSSLRNMFRYKKRLIMTIFGIAGSMGLMLVGYGIQDSVGDISAKQFTQLQHYDAIIIDDEDATVKERKELAEYLDSSEKIERYAKIQLGTMEAPREKSKLSVYVYVPEDTETFSEDITLKDRTTGEYYTLTDEGAVVSEKTCKLLNLEAGDMLTLEKDDKPYQVKIAVITENYMGHYVYMTPKVYEETFGEAAEFTDILFTMKEEYKAETEYVGHEILDYPAALSISYSTSIQGTVDRMLTTLNSVIIVLIVSAGLLAFVVLYNLNNINITERQRELATLKVLGFYDGEVSQYVFRENILLTILGILFGTGLGVILHRYVILTVEIDNIMFGRDISPMSFLYCTVFTAAFSGIINWIMHHKLKKIDMVESLKSVE